VNKLTFDDARVPQDGRLVAAPFSYREGCVLVWRCAAEQAAFRTAVEAFRAKRAEEGGDASGRGGGRGRGRGRGRRARRGVGWKASSVRVGARPREHALRIVTPEEAAARRAERGAAAPPAAPSDADGPAAAPTLPPHLRPQLEQLKAMGFPADAVGEAKMVRALLRSGGDVAAAMAHMFDE
jgi:hypothetical protein